MSYAHLIKPIHAAIKAYHAALKTYAAFYAEHEGATETAFSRLLADTAKSIEAFENKQHFLNTVHERFFQGYSVKVADTHGIVYTPKPIVDFMSASVEEVLKKEFGLTLGSPEADTLQTIN